MNIRLLNTLGKEIGAYHSHVVPRVKELVCVTAGAEAQLFKVWNVRYQVQNGECTSVDLEVMPNFEAASNKA